METEFEVRPYRPGDYEQVAALYYRPELYGGAFDAHRDAPERLQAQQVGGEESVLVAVLPDGTITGTVSLVEDGRVAWLFRFAVDRTPWELDVTRALHARAVSVLADRGHRQVLVYTPVGDTRLNGRYEQLGLNRGGDYTCYWADIGDR